MTNISEKELRSVTVAIGTLAEFSGIKKARLMQLAQDGVIKRSKQGHYLVWDSLAGYIQFLQDRSSSTVSNHDLNNERARLTHHQANKVALEEQQLDGQLLPADEVRRAWCKITSEIRSRLLALPTRLAQVAFAATTLHEIENACTDEIYLVLGDLSKVEYEESDISPDGER